MASPLASARPSAFTSSTASVARSGIVEPMPTSLTPGIAATSSCIRSNSAFASSSFRASKSNGTSMVRIRSVVRPVSTSES